jgi:hypothetical protein
MEATMSTPRTNGAAVLGLILLIVGAVALGARAVGVDLLEVIERAGWPFFVIVPGLILASAALLPRRPDGLGFAIAGTIVTTVGLVLLYQESTGHWESWAYAWALVGPGAAGIACVWYGLLARSRQLVMEGFRLAAVATALFVVGAWFFETIFRTGRAPVDIGTWWPALLIAAGLLTVVGAFVSRRRGARALPRNAQ